MAIVAWETFQDLTRPSHTRSPQHPSAPAPRLEAAAERAVLQTRRWPVFISVMDGPKAGSQNGQNGSKWAVK